MAKKKENKKENTVVEETTMVVEQPETNKKDNWEYKTRVYMLTNRQQPLSYTVRSSNIFYFDEEKGYERENIVKIKELVLLTRCKVNKDYHI